MLHPITADKQTLQYMSLITIHHQLDPAKQGSPCEGFTTGSSYEFTV